MFLFIEPITFLLSFPCIIRLLTLQNHTMVLHLYYPVSIPRAIRETTRVPIRRQCLLSAADHRKITECSTGCVRVGSNRTFPNASNYSYYFDEKYVQLSVPTNPNNPNLIIRQIDDDMCTLTGHIYFKGDPASLDTLTRVFCHSKEHVIGTIKVDIELQSAYFLSRYVLPDTSVQNSETSLRFEVLHQIVVKNRLLYLKNVMVYQGDYPSYNQKEVNTITNRQKQVNTITYASSSKAREEGNRRLNQRRNFDDVATYLNRGPIRLRVVLHKK
eukprot:91093_1